MLKSFLKKIKGTIIETFSKKTLKKQQKHLERINKILKNKSKQLDDVFLNGNGVILTN